jgi:hypothetical protein
VQTGTSVAIEESFKISGEATSLALLRNVVDYDQKQVVVAVRPSVPARPRSEKVYGLRVIGLAKAANNFGQVIA